MGGWANAGTMPGGAPDRIGTRDVEADRLALAFAATRARPGPVPPNPDRRAMPHAARRQGESLRAEIDLAWRHGASPAVKLAILLMLCLALCGAVAEPAEAPEAELDGAIVRGRRFPTAHRDQWARQYAAYSPHLLYSNDGEVYSEHSYPVRITIGSDNQPMAIVARDLHGCPTRSEAEYANQIAAITLDGWCMTGPDCEERNRKIAGRLQAGYLGATLLDFGVQALTPDAVREYARHYDQNRGFRAVGPGKPMGINGHLDPEAKTCLDDPRHCIEQHPRHNDPDYGHEVVLYVGVVWHVVWHKPALTALLAANRPILDRFGWPSDAAGFAHRVGTEWVDNQDRERADLYDLISVAYADPRFTPEHAIDPAPPNPNRRLPPGMVLTPGAEHLPPPSLLSAAAKAVPVTPGRPARPPTAR